jgi:two-component system, NtrC family, response regulator AtoC
MRDVSAQHHEFLGVEAIFASETMRRLLELVKRIAVTRATVLITGESGSGKEVIARAIHHHSLRCGKPWVDLNCAALPENLLESELFGYEKGAFSGADSSKPGLFELANGGTLFLDEIGDLDPRMQVKLLRILDGAPYYRLGGVRKVTADVRVVTATNRELKNAVQEGRFRSDLYHRLTQIKISVPPLRERPEDVVPLALHYLAAERADLRFSEEVMKKLLSYSWPGNVRELRNVVIRSAVLASGPEITSADLPEDFADTTYSGDLRNLANLAQMEREAIADALEKNGGRQQRAADQLGISKRTLQRKIKSYGLVSERAVLVAR